MSDISHKDQSKAPLHGIRVIDIGTMVAGPVAATLMADFGAEVIKVEQPKVGDTLRQLGPFAQDESLWWNVDGRNKKSITLNLRTQKGQNLLRKLIKQADVLVENFRPGTLKKWGLDYESLASINENLIMLSVSGFGQTGPYSNRAAYDRMALSFSGLMGINGDPNHPPVRFGTSIADYTAALMGAYAVMMGLYHRSANNGRGQHIDLALYEAIFRMSESMVSAYDQLGVVRKRTGNLHYGAAPGNNFLLNDGRYMTLTISGDRLFNLLCQAMNKPDLVEIDRFATHQSRWEHIEELNSIVADWLVNTPVEKVQEALETHGIPFSFVMSVDEIMENPQYKARENIAKVAHDKLGTLKMQSVVPRMSETPGVKIKSAPKLGEHNEEVFQNILGLTAQEMAKLTEKEII